MKDQKNSGTRELITRKKKGTRLFKDIQLVIGMGTP